MTHRWKGKTAAVLALMGAMSLLPGCGGPEANDPAGPVRLVVGLGSEPDAFNVYLARSASSLLVADLVLPRLAREELPFDDHPGGLVPELATGWEVGDQGRQVTMHLAAGRTWDDGQPIVCEDLQYTLEAQTNEQVAWRGASIKRHILSIECPDALTAIYHFDRGYPGQVMDINDLHVLSRSLKAIPFEQWRQTDWSRKLVAGATFRIDRVTPGQEIVLSRRQAGERGSVEEIILRIVPDAASRITQLLSGDLDLIEAVAPEHLPRLAGDDAVRLIRRPGHRYTYLGWNVLDPQAYATWRQRKEASCRQQGDDACLDSAEEMARLARMHPHPLLGDARVRRALTLALDRQTLIDTLLDGEGSIPPSPMPPPLEEHDPAIEPWPFDPAGARSLLAAAGFADSDGDGVVEREGRPLAFKLTVQAGRAGRRRAAEMVAQQLAAVGVRVELDPVENAAFYPALGAHRVDAWIGGWRTSLRVDMSEMLHASACASGGANFGCWSHPEADALADRARDEVDHQARVALWRQWEGLFHRELPYTLLYAPVEATAVRAEWQGPEQTILPGAPLAGVERWRRER